MAKILLRTSALIMAAVITSPAWAGWDRIIAFLPQEMPQPNMLAVMGIAVVGVVIGRFASRKGRGG